MTVCNIGWGPLNRHSAASGGATATQLTSTARYVMQRLVITKAGTIDRIAFNVSTRVGSPPNYKIGFVGITATTGGSSGVAFGGSALEEVAFPATGWVWKTIATPASVVPGDSVAAFIGAGVTPPDVSNYISVYSRYVSYVEEWSPSGGLAYTTSLSGSGGFGLAVKYNDGSICSPKVDNNDLFFGNNDSPDEIGGLFTLPFNCTCYGAKAFVSGSFGADYSIKLYAADDTLLGNGSCDISQITDGLTTKFRTHQHWVPVTLTKNTQYRLTVVPATTADVHLYSAVCEDNEHKKYFSEGTRWQLTQRTNAGAWTDSDLSIPYMALLLSDIDFSDTPTPPVAGGIPTIVAVPPIGLDNFIAGNILRSPLQV